MYNYSSIHKIFLDIHTFVLDYLTFLQARQEASNEIAPNLMIVKQGKELFCFPATLNDFSQRADELEHRLQRQLRKLVYQRRRNIEKGIDNIKETTFSQARLSTDLEVQLDELEKSPSNPMIRYVRAIIDALDLYDEIHTKKGVFDMTFRLFPLVKHIQKQLCCISRSIQKILDDNTSLIGQYLRRTQEKLNAYDSDMRKKLAIYIARDIRSPVLVIPCPADTCKEKMVFVNSNA